MPPAHPSRSIHPAPPGQQQAGFQKGKSLRGGRPPFPILEHPLKREMEPTALPDRPEVWAGACVREHRDSLSMGETSVAARGDPPRLTKP